MASHPDKDHYIYIDNLVGDRPVESIWLGGDIDRYSSDNFIDWVLEKQSAGVNVYHGFPVGYANEGLPLKAISCGLANVWFLTANVGDSKNANSIALLLEYDGFKALLPGDAQAVTQDSIIENFGALTEDIDLLFGSHHGSDSHGSNQGTWPEHTNPRVIVYSSGDKYKHPKCGIVGNYHDRLISTAPHPVWCSPREDDTSHPTAVVTHAEYITEVNGIVVVETDGEDINVTCSKR